MKKSTKVLLISLAVALILVGFLSVIYFTSPIFYIVTEEPNSFSTYTFEKLLIKNNYRPIKENLTLNTLTDSNKLNEILNEYCNKGSVILLSPMISQIAIKNGFRTQSDNAVIIAMTTNKGNDNFDFYLTDSSRSGVEAITNYLNNNDYKPLLIYNYENTQVKELLNIDSICSEDYGSRFPEQVKIKLDENGYNLIICPFLNDISNLFEYMELDTDWIVDSEIKDTIPENYLKGYLKIDLSKSLEPIIKNLKHVPSITVPLQRTLVLCK